MMVKNGLKRFILKSLHAGRWLFLTAILHRSLRNCFFFNPLIYFFQFLFGLLFSLFSLDFYFPFFLGLLFSLRTFISLFSLDFYSIRVTFWISSKFYYWIWNFGHFYEVSENRFPHGGITKIFVIDHFHHHF